MWRNIKCISKYSKYLKVSKKLQKRYFMSDTFSCQPEWAQRFNSPILQKVIPDELFYEIETKYQKTGKVSSVDADIFINAINDGLHFEEMQDLVYKLRLTPEACNIFLSTQHAFIRTYFKHGNSKELLKILGDRLNYGIFPDDYLLLLMMDTFIKQKDFTSAAKVGVLPMLQEECDNPLVKYLSLYSCHNFLLKPEQWVEEKKKEEVTSEEEEEEIKIRVPYLRNPYFDEHFDIIQPNDLIGKTFIMFGETIDNNLGKSYKLLGLVLHKKWETSLQVSDSLLKNNEKIYSSHIELTDSYLSQFSTEDKELTDTINEVKEKLKLIKSKGLIMDESALDALETLIKDEVVKNEKYIIQEQCKIYKNWEDYRENRLKKELEEIKKKALLEEINKKKESLAVREEELFFFDREDVIDLKIEKKMKFEDQNKLKQVESSEYVPPEVVKRRTPS